MTLLLPMAVLYAFDPAHAIVSAVVGAVIFAIGHAQ